MPAESLKRKQVRIYLDEEDAPLFEQIAANAGKLSEAALMTMIVSAGLHAIREAGGRITLPLNLSVGCSPSALILNDAPPKPRK